MSAGDDLLRWVSETGSGSWDRLRDAAAYLCQRHELTRRPWTLASELSALGHLDIDWSTREWSVAPPHLNLIPGLGICLVLTGSRPFHVDQRFAEATDAQEVYPFDIGQDPSPAAKFAKCASVSVAEQVASRLGAQLIPDPATSLVNAMRAVDEVPLLRAAPPALEEARRFDAESLQWEFDDSRQPGLYRVDIHGRPVHRRLDDHGMWWDIDLAAGQFLAVRSRRTPVLRWRPGTRNGSIPSYLEVRREISLPIVAERAGCVSSGFVPNVVDGWRRYLNVPQDLASAMAQKLLHSLGS